MKVLKYWKIVEFQKISIKVKNCKTFYETQTASPLKEIIQPPPTPIPPYKILLGLWNKIFLERYTEIYRHLISQCFKKVVLGRQEMMQCKCFFLTPNRNMSARKFVDWESFLAVFWEHIIFNFKRVDIRKISEIFWAKMYCKMGGLSRWFLLGLRISAINSGIKIKSDDVHWNVWNKVVRPK